MTMYMVKRVLVLDHEFKAQRGPDGNWLEETRSLIRDPGGNQLVWTPKGWVPGGGNEWTGIGGSADWEEVDEEGARAAIVEMGGDPASLDSADDRVRRFMQKYQ